MSWKELSNEEDLPPEFTPPPRPRPPIDPPNGKDDLVNSDPTHFFTEIIENSAEICANRSACQYLLSTPNIFSLVVAIHTQQPHSNTFCCCFSRAPQTFTDGPDLRRRMIAAGEVGATPLSSEQPDDPIVPREAPPKPARSPPKTPTAEAVPAPASGAWSPLMASVCMCTVLAAGAYVCYRTYFH